MNGRVNGTTSNRYITACIEWTVVSQDKANNTSTVEAVLLYRKSSASTAATYGTISGYLNLHDFGAYFSKRVRFSPNNSWVEVCRCTRTVTHDSKGQLTISLSASGAISGTTLTATHVNGSIPLPEIPRASTISAQSFTLGQAGTIDVDRADDSFVHTLEYWYGNTRAAIVEKTDSTSVTWTPPLSLASETPDAVSGTGTLICTTYSGDQQIGQSAANLTLQVPASVVPVISGVAVAEATAGLEKQFGAFVQSKSALTIRTTAKGAYGASIASCRVTVDGRTYSGTTVTTEALTASGTLPVTVEVVDSRGRWATDTVKLSVLPYAPPTISSLTVMRCDEKGNLDESGDYAAIRYAFTIAPVGGKNSHSAQFEYKRRKGTEGDWAALASDEGYQADATIKPLVELQTDYRWDIRLTVSDYFGSVNSTALLRSSEVIIDLLASGDGMGIGKTAETRGALELAWQLIADIPLLDQAVDNIADLSARTVTIENAYITTEQVSTLLAGKVNADDLSAYRAEVGKLLAGKADVSALSAATARVGALETGKADVTDLSAVRGQVDNLTTRTSTIEQAYISTAEVGKLLADKADVSDLTAAVARVDTLDADKASVTDLSAAKAQIEQLETDKLSAADAELKYANIDFSNIGKAAIEQLYATSGIIKNLVIGDSTITGELVGVTIRGDLIEGGTVVADKLVVKGEDGLYYKLNTDGVTTEAQQTDYNSLSGQIIRAKSITASKIAVDDLVAFGATIGGFHLTDSALYSGVKDSPTNTTRGVYLDSAGQLCVGDSKSYLRYYKDSSGQYRLEIAAASMTLSTGQSVEEVLQDVSDKAQTAQKAIDAVEVGGTNLLEGSRTLQSLSVTGDLVDNAYHDLTAVKTYGAWQGIYVDLPSVVSKWGLQAGDIVTHSVMVMTDFDADTVCNFYLFRAPGKTDAINLGDYILHPGKWQKISVTFAIPEGEMSSDMRIESNYYADSNYTYGGKCMYFAAPKLERGNKATDWTPAPEDVSAKLDLCITTDPADRSKVISAINASADAIALKSNRLTIDSDNFKLAADGTVTATAGDIAGFKMRSKTVAGYGFKQRSLLGGYEADGKEYGLCLIPQSASDDWDSEIVFVNGSGAVALIAERRETEESFERFSITGAPLNPSHGINISWYDGNGKAFWVNTEETYAENLRAGNFTATGVTAFNSSVTVNNGVSRAGGGMWRNGRDNATAKGTSRGQTSGDSFNVVASQLTSNGAWAIGNLSGEEGLYFSYTTNSDYNSGSNGSTNVTLSPSAGEIPIVVAQGTSGIWTYIKYSSGIAVCYGRREQGGLNVNQAWGGIYTSGANTISAINYPFTFTSAPSETVSVMCGAAKRSAWLISSETQNTTEKTATYEFARGTANWEDAVISYVVCGRWK